MRRRWKIIAAVAVPAVAAMVVLHTSAGRALLGSAGGCPWNKPASPERLEDFRQKAVVAALKTNTTTRAAAHPAFVFELDKSTKADVLAWGKKIGAPCNEELGGAALRCEPQNGEPVRDAFFRFDPSGVLVGADLVRDGTDGEKAVSVVKEISERVAREAGPPQAVGSAAAASVGSYLDRTSTAFRFADYAADVTATNMGERGVVVREQYRSIPN
jgi:hypothetical protein